MTADPLLTRIAVAIHGATPPNPDAALALHRAQAERVAPVVEAEVARLRAAVEAWACNCGGQPRTERHASYCSVNSLRAALATAEDQP